MSLSSVAHCRETDCICSGRSVLNSDGWMERVRHCRSSRPSGCLAEQKVHGHPFHLHAQPSCSDNQPAKHAHATVLPANAEPFQRKTRSGSRRVVTARVSRPVSPLSQSRQWSAVRSRPLSMRSDRLQRDAFSLFRRYNARYCAIFASDYRERLRQVVCTK
jgi:hypothetical protein